MCFHAAAKGEADNLRGCYIAFRFDLAGVVIGVLALHSLLKGAGWSYSFDFLITDGLRDPLGGNGLLGTQERFWLRFGPV